MMEISREGIRKNRIIAFAVTFLALVLLLLTFALKGILTQQCSLNKEELFLLGNVTDRDLPSEIFSDPVPAALKEHKRSDETTNLAASDNSEAPSAADNNEHTIGASAEGISIELKNRELLSIPSTPNASAEGNVVLQIIVNSEGIVTDVSNSRETHVSAAELVDEAINFARQIRFSQSQASEQRGRVTIQFRYR